MKAGSIRKYITAPGVRRYEEADYCKVNFLKNQGMMDLHQSIKAWNP